MHRYLPRVSLKKPVPTLPANKSPSGNSILPTTMLSEAIKAPFLASDDLLVQPSTVGDLLPMVAVDQLEGMTVASRK